MLVRAWFMSLFFPGIAQSISCGNITISNAKDAEEVRKDCKIITGNLEFSSTISESINLDGIEVVQGSIYHDNENCREEYCSPSSEFEISFPTLREVGRDIFLWQTTGLRSLLLPNLTTVEGGLSLMRQHDLQRLDITKLAYFGHFKVEAGNLTTLDHEVLEGLTSKYGPPYIDFGSIGVESVDSFLKRPLELTTNTDASAVLAFGNALPNVRNITLGWSKVSTVLISGDNLSVTLGTSNTTDMEIENLQLNGNITALQIHPNLKNLTVREFTMEGQNGEAGAIELDLSFTNISSISIDKQSHLERIRLPPEAEFWQDLSIDIPVCEKLNLSSEYAVNDDGTKEKVWYWPQSDIQSIRFFGNPISNEFFASFLESHANGRQGPKVLRSFSIVVHPNQTMDFDCTPFDELRDRGILPSDPGYFCYNDTMKSMYGSGSSRGLPDLWMLGLSFLLLALV